MSNKILIWLGLTLVLLFSFRLHDQRALSFHFVDEEDHIVTADFMNQGLKLYKDLSVNHQPLVYLGSQALQKVAKPNSIYLLIKTHRMAMFVYGALWSVLLVTRFGIVGLIFSLFFEGLKFYGFGNLWLMESMAVYPAVYLFGSLVNSFLSNKWPKKRQSFWLGICSFLVVFNLVPLWPWLVMIWLVMLIKNKKYFWWQVFGSVVPTMILFLLISPVDWFRETINYNVIYAMPRLSVIKTTQDWLRIIFFPFLAFFTKKSFQAKIISWLFSGLSISLILKWKNNVTYKYTAVLIYVTLVLANLRSPNPEEVFYGGFHLLPWLGMLLIAALLLIKQIKNKWIVLGLSIWGLGLLLNKNMPYFWQTDTMAEYQINYSRFDDLNWAVKQIVEPSDKMAVLSSESLIYWQTGVVPATRQVVYYAWEHDVPRLKEEYKESFYGVNPPEFIYGSNEQELVKKDYVQLLQDNKPTELFLHQDKKIDAEKLINRNYSLIEKNE